MIQRIRKFALRLHRDETGPNTVEWILLIIVALILLIFIYKFANWALNKFRQGATTLQGQSSFQ